MHEQWFQDLEALEAINQDEETRAVILRMAGLARADCLGPFIDAVHADGDLDHETKACVLELASDSSFLLAAEDYLLRCGRQH